jgi:hypothetical protein
MDEKEIQIRQNCHKKAIHCLGTSYIFQEKAKRYARYLKWISILGIIVPLTIGGIAMGYGQYSQYLSYLLVIAIPLSILQLILSGIDLIYKWGDSLSYSLESQSENRKLSEEFHQLAKDTSIIGTELEHKFELLKIMDDARSQQDEKITFSSKEKRKGMRYALKMFQIDCATCKKVPIDMEPTSCDNCGKF